MDKLKWVLAAVVAVAVLIIGGTWVYINVIRDDPPERLAFDAEPTGNADEDEATDPDPTTTTTDGDAGPGADAAGDAADPGASVEGRWMLADGSMVGYRVTEVLFGQSAEGVGRTSDIDGHLVIESTTVTEAEFAADMATVESDDSRRDRQFRGRIMDVDNHPTATLVLVEPIELGTIPEIGEIVEVTALVDLTLRGNTRTVPVDLRARHTGDTIEIDGAVTVVFDEWGIPNPSTVGITTDEEGELEFVLIFDRG